ncbi:MAG: peptide-methionine (S)-S-oxide reductase MsrA [Chitinophagaceae bacterium]|nr:peptide-methionine (S)-S-oxide reductase MsrA [Chitinophagaceae bacterium]
MKAGLTTILISLTALLSCAQRENPNKSMSNSTSAITASPNGDTSIKTETATFANGCFWCTEAIFQQLKGVMKVTSGYSGGHVVNPTYKEVTTGTTGHAECIQILYDPAIITYDELLEVFWQTHDPTTLNRQGNDVGTQYRSSVFYHNPDQKDKAEKYKIELNKSGAFENPIVTEVVPFSSFYIAENYHQDYYNANGSQPYCYYVIRPKLEKFKKVFGSKMKN